jgi:hypothetical protein
MPVTPGHVRSSSLTLRLGYHITSLFLSVDCWDEDAPGLSRCSGASGCQRPAPRTMLRIVFVAVDAKTQNAQ